MVRNVLVPVDLSDRHGPVYMSDVAPMPGRMYLMIVAVFSELGESRCWVGLDGNAPIALESGFLEGIVLLR